MEEKALEITLVPASDDLPEESAGYQDQLREFDASLQQAGLNPSAVVEFIEAVGHDIAPYMGVFTVAISSTLGIVGPTASAWLNGKLGRKIRVKVDGIEVEAPTWDEVEKGLDKAHKIRQHDEPKRIIP